MASVESAAVVVGPVVFLRNLSVFILYAGKTSLMTKFKCIIFNLFPVFFYLQMFL